MLVEKGLNDQGMHAEVLNLEEKREQPRIKLDSYPKQLRKAFNKKVRGRSFQEGDLVLKEVTQVTKEKEAGKLSANWEGAYIIHKCQSAQWLGNLTSGAILGEPLEWQ
ncbi:hypothetical protein IFM89_004345 [Coptis chinensis]|uniref:Uncharacterized protein n=1 Tax=Coptis chinensis TaxID=261450 RepID=A0A835I977_9MAGN|nr:hypothetical protein IFM89_004345 [Coptis chinensis]